MEREREERKKERDSWPYLVDVPVPGAHPNLLHNLLAHNVSLHVLLGDVNEVSLPFL
jgi:hypothetical protein